MDIRDVSIREKLAADPQKFPVTASYPDTKVVLVGDGSLRPALTQRAAALGLANIIFAGFQRDTRAYFRLFDIFVLPSLFEGLPVSVIQAMAAGCPVVATNVGGVPEVVENGVTGLLVAPGRPDELSAALRRLIADPALRTLMSERGRERAAGEFSAQVMISSSEKIYSALLGSPA